MLPDNDIDRATVLGNLQPECQECGGEGAHELGCSALHDCAAGDGEYCRGCAECYRATGETVCGYHCEHGKHDRGEI